MPGASEDLRPGHRGCGGLVLAPFRGVRFASSQVGDLGAVTSPPYDLIDDEGVRTLMEAAPHNVVRLILPQEDAAGGDQRYARAARTLRRWLDEGALVADPTPAVYVYEQVSAERTQRGLIGGLGVVPPEDEVVLPHEDVLPGPVADRLALMKATQANLEPIFCIYEGGGQASLLVEDAVNDGPPACEVVADGAVHRLWPITDGRRLDAIADDLRGRQALIADGHHRYATYLRLQAEHRAAGHGPGPWDFGLALLVDSARYPPQLKAIHRVIPGLDPAEAVERVRPVCRVLRVSDDLVAAAGALAAAAASGPAFLVAGDGRHHLVTAPDPTLVDRSMSRDRSPRWRRLATAVLHTWLIPEVWGIGDPRMVRLFHNDASAAVRAATGTGGTAVLLAPLATGEVFALAAEGERVPHKSTSFGPKPRTGLLLRTFAAG